MARVLRFLGTRYGAALSLVLILAMVISGFRLGTSSSSPGMAPALGPSTAISVYPTGFDGVVPNAADSGRSEATGISASASAAATNVASQFTTAWLRHTGISAEQWRKGMATFATKTLMAQLTTTDPSRVPASKIDGNMTIIAEQVGLLTATVPLDSGQVRLKLITVNGQWKVDGIDWQRPT
jgi:hypothetical protein